jgi:transcription antitermination factor NusG
MDPWHLAVTRLGLQRHAIAALQGLPDITEVYAPSRSMVRVIRGQRISREIPWLGPLVLARWDGDNPHIWHDVRRSLGVTGIVGGEFPKPIREGEVERLRAWLSMLETRGQADLKPAPCAIGDEIMFSYLAFQNTIGKVDFVGDDYADVKIALLGYPTIVPVPFDAVERIIENEWGPAPEPEHLPAPEVHSGSVATKPRHRAGKSARSRRLLRQAARSRREAFTGQVIVL